MSRRLVECVPNISEGRDRTVIAKLTASIEAISHVVLLDVHVDPDHHRSVFTMIGEPEAMATALFGLVRDAQQHIDIQQHQGAHPRIGAVDVVPWVPFQGVTMEDCVTYSKQLGARIGEELEIPVFLYEQAGNLSGGRKLEMIRRGGLSALGNRMETNREWQPDYGPSILHPTAGAIAVGARFFLIAFNVVLQSNDLLVAGKIAKAIRTSGGGLSAVKAMGMPLASRKRVQVSMNLLDYRETSLRMAFESVVREAKSFDIEVLESELVGLVPQAAWDEKLSRDLKFTSMESDPIIEYCLKKSSAF